MLVQGILHLRSRRSSGMPVKGGILSGMFKEDQDPPLKTREDSAIYKCNLTFKEDGERTMNEKRTIGIYVRDDVLERIRYASEEMFISRNQLIAELLEFGIDCYEQDEQIRYSVNRKLDEVLVPESTSKNSEVHQ